MTEPDTRRRDTSALKAEARRLSRTEGGPSYCQALDSLARDAGHPHWKALMRKRDEATDVVVPAPEGAFEVSPEAARSSSAKINAWISRAMESALPDPAALMSVLTDRDMPYGGRVAAARRCFGSVSTQSDDVLEAAVVLVAGIAHDALVHGDVGGMPWRRTGGALSAEDLVRAVEGMSYAGPVPGRNDHQDDASVLARWGASTSSWFRRRAAASLAKGRVDESDLLLRLSDATHGERIGVLHLVAPLRLLCEPRRAAFERMIAERYAAMTSGTPEDHAEAARATLDVHLVEGGIAFGDPETEWDRELADELADVDLEHWTG